MKFFRKSKIFSAALYAACSIAFAGEGEYRLEDNSTIICEGFGENKDRPPIYLYTEEDGRYSSLSDIKPQQDRGAKPEFTRKVLDGDNLKQICNSGYPIKAFAVLFTKATDQKSDPEKKAASLIPSKISAPASFTINRQIVAWGAYETLGNFWVPDTARTMPAAHTTH
jgi:hypothetical protein